jgi:hypothetical protein
MAMPSVRPLTFSIFAALEVQSWGITSAIAGTSDTWVRESGGQFERVLRRDRECGGGIERVWRRDRESEEGGSRVWRQNRESVEEGIKSVEEGQGVCGGAESVEEGSRVWRRDRGSAEEGSGVLRRDHTLDTCWTLQPNDLRMVTRWFSQLLGAPIAQSVPVSSNATSEEQ